MQVMTNLGMGRIELEEMLDAVKASNEYSEGAAGVIEDALPRIRELARGRGWHKADIDWLAAAIPAFAGTGCAGASRKARIYRLGRRGRFSGTRPTS